MKKSCLVLLYVFSAIAMILFVAGCGSQSNPNQNNPTGDANQTPKMIDCTNNSNPGCFITPMEKCLPVTARMTGTGGENIIVTVIGYENETCHFQRKINDAISLECFFPKGVFNMSVLDQTFGNDKGLQSIVDAYCK